MFNLPGKQSLARHNDPGPAATDVINARKDDLRDISSDVCIIGAGATGIAIARALSQQGFRICLLESGGFEPDPATQSLYTGAITGVRRVGGRLHLSLSSRPPSIPCMRFSLTRLCCYPSLTSLHIDFVATGWR